MLDAALAALVKQAVKDALREAGVGSDAAADRKAAANEPAVLSYSDLAKRWRVSPAYVRLLKTRGLIKVVHFGSRSLVPMEEVRRLERDGIPSTGTGKRMAQPPGGAAEPGAIFGEPGS